MGSFRWCSCFDPCAEQKGLISKQRCLPVTALGRLQGWAGLVQMLRAFDAGLVRVAVGPLGNASDAEGQDLVWKPRSQQAS